MFKRSPSFAALVAVNGAAVIVAGAWLTITLSAQSTAPSIAGSWTRLAADASTLVQTADDKPVNGDSRPAAPSTPNGGATDGATGKTPTSEPKPVPGAYTGGQAVAQKLEGYLNPSDRPAKLTSADFFTELTTAPERLTISFEPSRVTVESDRGQVMHFATNGNEEKHQFLNGVAKTKTKWNGAALHQDVDAGPGAKYTETYELADGGKTLVVTLTAKYSDGWGLSFLSRTAIAGNSGSEKWIYARTPN